MAASEKSDSRSTQLSAKLSPELKAFYESHNVHGVEELFGDVETHTVRFIRLNPRHDKAETLGLLENELGSQSSRLVPIPWLDERFGFYAVPGDFSISQSKAFQSGRIYGMDVSSGAAVAALISSGRNTDVRVLDLCCSPGLKLCMMADLLSSSSTIVGVDISERRLALCKNIVKKYHVDPGTSGCPRDSSRVRIRLYCADGTKFGTEPDPELIFDSVAATEEQKTAGTRKRMNKSARTRERKRLRQLSSVSKQSSTIESEISVSESSPLTTDSFDFVLVDAECSTDGSLKHVQQRVLKKGGLRTESDDYTTASNLTLTNPEKLKSLVELQNGLIETGFNLLKPGGVLVYSTCSLSVAQNEGVVAWFLENHKDSFVIPVKFPLAEGSRVGDGTLEGTVRFLPRLATTEVTDSGASLYGCGFFLAKIGKLAVRA